MQLIANRTFTYLIIGSVFMACSPGSGGSQENTADYRSVDAAMFRDLIAKKGGTILDVRTGEEVDAGHIPNCVNLDFYLENFSEELKKLDKSKPVFVYCAAGGRSSKAASMLKELKFNEVINLEGGFTAWQNAGFKVEK